MAQSFLVIAACTLLVLIVGSDPIVTPDFAVVPEFGRHALECSFAAALTSCQVRVFEPRSFDTYLDFSQGSESPGAPVKYTSSGSTATLAQYHGTGLENGSCGVQLPTVPQGQYVLLCRGRVADGGWLQGVAILIATAHTIMGSSSLNPRMIVAQPGHSVSVLLSARRGRMDQCDLAMPSSAILSVNDRRPVLPEGGRFRRFGAGRAAGDCGFTVDNVNAADGGLWLWSGWQGRRVTHQAVIVLVAASPKGKPVLLDLPNEHTDEARHGDGVLTCTTPPSIPPANLTWVLNGNVFREDPFNDTLDGETTWALPWMAQSTSQRLASRSLALSDVDKKWECRMDHLNVHAVSELTQSSARAQWECGRRLGGARLLSMGGKEAQQAEFPWHVGVFEERDESYSYICGGSLVTVKFFISAAHCFFDVSGSKMKDASVYRASVGKHTLSWDTVDKDEQRRSIETIHVPVYFTGSSTRYEADIAVVRLSEPVLVTLAVNVVCVAWTSTDDSEHNQVTPGSLGTVPGWGVTENNTLSSTLRYVELPFVDVTDCRKSVPIDFKNFLLADKMCGGFTTRSTSVCLGDSGGGYVFPSHNPLAGVRYYLRGVVSTAPNRRGLQCDKICQAEHRSAFTKISSYATWMKGIVFLNKLKGEK